MYPKPRTILNSLAIASIAIGFVAIRGHIIATTEFVGTYAKSR